MRRTPTEHGVRARELVKQREQMLAQHATRTLEVTNVLVAKLMRYLENEGVQAPTLFQVTPADAVGWLTLSGLSGFTPVHVGSCPHWGMNRNDASCGCPKRKTAPTLRKEAFSLQGACRRAGLTSQWCPLKRAGNPFTAPQVAAFLEVTEREQTAGGVGAVQAALVDESVYEALMRATQRAWLRNQNADQPVQAMEAARDGLFYSMLWNTGLRASDALRLEASQLQLFQGGVYVAVAVSKGSGKSTGAHRITVRDPPASKMLFAASTSYRQWTAAVEALGLDPRTQSPFASAVMGEDGAVVGLQPCSWKDMHARHQSWMSAAGFSETARNRVTLHSFHGSRAARERDQDVSPQQTCEDMHWSMQMYEHYTKGRDPLTLEAVLRE